MRFSTSIELAQAVVSTVCHTEILPRRGVTQVTLSSLKAESFTLSEPVL